MFQAVQKKKKTNKIWVDQGSEFYNGSSKKWLKDNSIEMYSTYNQEKSVVAERFIRTLKIKIFRHMTALSKKIFFFFFDALDDIVDEYNNTFHRTFEMKLIDVKSDSYA